jgi:hypothetical protein
MVNNAAYLTFRPIVSHVVKKINPEIQTNVMIFFLKSIVFELLMDAVGA